MPGGAAPASAPAPRVAGAVARAAAAARGGCPRGVGLLPWRLRAGGRWPAARCGGRKGARVSRAGRCEGRLALSTEHRLPYNVTWQRLARGSSRFGMGLMHPLPTFDPTRPPAVPQAAPTTATLTWSRPAAGTARAAAAAATARRWTRRSRRRRRRGGRTRTRGW